MPTDAAKQFLLAHHLRIPFTYSENGVKWKSIEEARDISLSWFQLYGLCYMQTFFAEHLQKLLLLPVLKHKTQVVSMLILSLAIL